MGKLVYDNIVFEDKQASFTYLDRGDFKNTNTEVLISSLKRSFNEKKKSELDGIALNILSAYSCLKKNQLYEALKFQVQNEKDLPKNGNKKLQLANKLVGVLIYEKQEAYGLACSSLESLAGGNIIERYQIDVYLASIKQREERFNDAYNKFKKALPLADQVSLIDNFYCLINLSKICNELGKNKEQLVYALKADTLITSNRTDVFNAQIDYAMAEITTASVKDELKKLAQINLSLAYRKNKQYTASLVVLNALIEREKKEKSSKILMEAYINKALTYTFLEDYNNATYSYYDALKLAETENDVSKKCEIYNLLAKNNYLDREYRKAVDLCISSTELAKKNSDYNNLAASYYILSEIYARDNDYLNSQKFFKLYNETKEILEKQKQSTSVLIKNKNSETKLLTQKAESDILEDEKKQLEGINNKMLDEQKEKEFLLLKQENELRQKDLLNQRLEKEQVQRNLDIIKEQLEKEQLTKRYTELNREREIKSLESKNNRNEIKLLNSQKKVYVHESELKSNELNASKSRQRMLIGAFSVLLLFLASLGYFFFKMNKQKKIIELYNRTIQKTNMELRDNVQRVTEQKSVIEEKNDEILDSINYALRIQKSLLLSEKNFREYFKESFILFYPKEIVSGDFYLVKQKGDELFLAVVDCTGHGVPGAMITAIAYQELVHLIDTTTLSPGPILDVLNERINFLLNSNNLIGSDGMDLTLLSINSSKRIINYAGAKSIFLLNSGNEWKEVKTDKKSIGEFIKKGSFHFETGKLVYNSGDSLYLYTDGFPDQFSELESKRIGSKRFKARIEEIANLQMEKQKNSMEEFLNHHKKKSLQTDDITLIAIKLV